MTPALWNILLSGGGLLGLVQEPTLGGILSEQKVEFADEADSVSTAGKAIARSKKAVRAWVWLALLRST